MTQRRQLLWIIGAGLVGILFLTSVYFTIVSLAESPRYAMRLLWTDRLIVAPLIIGFGIQSALYIILKKRLFIPITNTGQAGALTGVSGTTSALAMVACCVHHVTDVLPILGLTAAATFLAEYRTPFMLVGLGTTVIGILIMLCILFRERRRVIDLMSTQQIAATS